MTKQKEINIDELTKRRFDDLLLLQKKQTSVFGFFENRMNVWDGEAKEYRFGDIITTQIIEKALPEHPVVLDIGCGESGGVPKFLRETFNIQAFGILAPTGAELPDYIHGVDAHFLSEEKCFHSIEFDFIFSHLAFLHFVNPIKALQEAYLKLKVNGIMLINQLVIPGLSQIEFINMMEYMRNQGYELTYCAKPGNPYMGWSTLVIYKTNDKPKLLFPVEIKKVEDNKQEVRAIYSLTTPSQSISEAKNNDIYQEIKSKLYKRINKIGPKGKSGVEWAFIQKKIQINKSILLEEIFTELLPLSNLLKVQLNAENPLVERINSSIFDDNGHYLENFLYLVSTETPDYLSNVSLDDFVEAIMFVTHQEYIVYQNAQQFSKSMIAMGLPPSKRDIDHQTYHAPSILKKVIKPYSEFLQEETKLGGDKSTSPEIKHMPESLKDLILDSHYWITQSVLSLSIPVGIKNMQDLIKKPEYQKIMLKHLREAVAKRPKNGSKKYYFFTHEQVKITEDLYSAITNASTWENLLNSKACQDALKDRQTFYQSIGVTIPYSP